MEKSESRLKRFLRFDLVRASKLIEIVQSAVIILVLAFFVGTFIDSFWAVTDEEAAEFSHWQLAGSIFSQFLVIVVTSYYIHKIALVIPFYFSLTKDYVPAKKNEPHIGSNIAMSIIFITVQQNFVRKLREAHSRFGFNVPTPKI